MAFEGFCSVVPDASFERGEGHSRLLFPAVPLPLFNCVIVESEPCPGVLESLREIERFSAACGVQLREGRHEAVEAVVERHGFTDRTAMPGMALAPAELVDEPVDELTIGRATDQDELAEAARVAAAGFGGPIEAIAPLYTRPLLSLDGFAVYVGRVAGEAVTTGIGYRLGSEVAIFSVATAPEQRRRGYGGAISAHAARAGFDAGADLTWLQTSSLGEPVYRRLGFRHVVRHVLLTRP